MLLDVMAQPGAPAEVSANQAGELPLLKVCRLSGGM